MKTLQRITRKPLRIGYGPEEWERLGEVVSLTRSLFGWKVEDLVREAGVARETIQRIESGAYAFSPYYRTVVKVLEALGYRIEVRSTKETAEWLR